MMAETEREAIQAHLRGIYTDHLGGCPHLRRFPDIDRCEMMEMHPCVYETGDGPCDIFLEIIEEWRKELWICPECGQQRPGDERVAAGMKCGLCAGYAVSMSRGKNYTPVATYPSSSDPSKTYTVSVDEQGNLSCTCPAWVFKKGAVRTCKHVEDYERNGAPVAPAPVPQAGTREKGGTLADLFAKLEKGGLDGEKDA